MGEIIFSCDERNYLRRQADNSYRGPQGQEYYEGDYRILPGNPVEVRIEKGLACTFPILNLRTRSELHFRRSWSHIQHDKTDVSVLWFVRRGRIAVCDHGGRNIVESGECTITRSLQPFHMEILVDDDAGHEVLHVVAPTHILRSYIPDTVSSGTPFSFHDGGCRVAEQTLTMLYEEGQRLDRHVAEEFVRAAFGAVGQSMSTARFNMPKTLGERRLSDILDYVARQLSNPDLSATAVADGCGISTRYLYSILRSHDTSFSDVLWQSRLERTKTWLTATAMQHVPIAKIAYMAGFKSAAHFSRMFKRATRTTPRDFRHSAMAASSPDPKIGS
jgi:AraC-like DNA-binding protein